MKQSVHLRHITLVCLCGLMPASLLPMTHVRAAEPDSATSAPVAAYAANVAALIAANPEGGPEAETALGALVAAQRDGATAVATLMAALGASPSSGLVSAVSGAITKAATYTPDELAAAIATVIVASLDPATAAAGIVAAVAILPPAMQAAAGSGLAAASATFALSGNPAAASITAIVTAASIPIMAESFTSTASTIAVSLNQSRQSSGKPFDGTREIPASAS